MCDEAWALGIADVEKRRQTGLPPERLFSPAFYFAAAVTLWLAWFGSATAGAAVGQSLGDLSRWGFAMAFPTIMLALVGLM